jgi:hypothetical protein
MPTLAAAERLLSSREREDFARDGFLVQRGLLAARIGDITRMLDELGSWPEVPGRHWVYYENSVTEPKQRVLSRIERFGDFHAGLGALMQGPELKGRIGELFGEEALLFKEKVNFKMPGGQGFEPHQDMQAGWDEYGSLHISAMVTVDRATEENGCLELAAGHHKQGLIGEKWKPLQGAELDGLDFVKVPTEPGDVVFFDSFTPHRSAPNLSAQRRRILYLTYGRASDGDQRERYYADKHKNFPPDIERDPGRSYEYKV